MAVLVNGRMRSWSRPRELSDQRGIWAEISTLSTSSAKRRCRRMIGFDTIRPTRFSRKESHMKRVVLTAISFALLLTSTSEGEAPDANVASDSTGNVNLEQATLGGKQFWSDEFCYGGWRIQRNTFTGHCRLLDGENVRRAWGKFAECLNRLSELERQGEVERMKSRVVLVLHGLGRTRSSMDKLCRHLEEHGDYTTINISYASTRHSVAHHAAALGRIINHLDQAEEINFVGHSLGNLVVRHYLADQTDPAKELRPDRRILRIVMLAPPNNGSVLAVRLKKNPLFRTFWGESGIEIAEQWGQLEKHLAVPQCEFGIIAGGRGSEPGLNPLLPGDNDLVLTVEETRLPGANDFIVLPVSHSFIMTNQLVHQHTLRFLEGGRF